MRRFSLFILTIAISGIVFAQENVSVTKTLQRKYDIVHYSNGWYKIGHSIFQYGACDEKGNLLISPEYDNVELKEFEKKNLKYWILKKGMKYGAFAYHGEMIFPIEYDALYAPVRESYPYWEVKQNGVYYIYDIAKKLLLSVEGDYDRVSYYPDIMMAEVIKGQQAGMVNIKGALVLPLEFEHCYYRKEGQCIEIKKGGLSGIADINGKILLQPKYNTIFSFGKSDYAVVKNQLGKYGMIDKEYKEFVPTIYDNIWGHFEYSKYEIIEKDGKFGVLSIDGKEIIPCLYSYIQVSYNDLIYVVKNGNNKTQGVGFYDKPLTGKWGLYDKKGSIICDCKYDYIGELSEDLILINNGGTKQCSQFSTDWKVAGGKWGYIDLKGNEVIPCVYDIVEPFTDGIAQVQKDGKASVLTHPQGTKLIVNSKSTIPVDNNIPKTNRANEDTFAFIIANENYSGMNSDYSINDGQVFKEYCSKTLGIPEKNIRYYEDATFGQIVNAVKKIEDYAEVYEGDAKIIIYFSGLGITENKEKYFLPIDASLTSITTTGYRVSNLMDKLGVLDLKHAAIILDAPFNGKDKAGKAILKNRGVAISVKSLPIRGNIALCMASNDGTAFSSEELGHSLFTFAILEKIQQSKGECTIGDLMDYVEVKVKQESLEKGFPVQSPQIELGNQNLKKIKLY